MSGRDSGGTSVADAIGMAVIVFAVVMFFIVVAIVTFLASPGMLIVGSAKLAFGLTHSGRQVWVLSIATSLTILIALVLVFRDLAKGVATHLLLCAVTMIVWSVLTYGLESRATEKLAAVFFPGFTVDGAVAETQKMASAAPGGAEDRSPGREEGAGPAEAVEPTRVDGRLTTHGETEAEAHRAPDTAELRAPAPQPSPNPLARLRIALQLPLKRAYVMVRLNDREVFRCDFRPGRQDGTPGLVTPPIEAVAGPAVLKVWVISPDKKEADEYVVLPMELRAGENAPVSLELVVGKDLGKRLIPAS